VKTIDLGRTLTFDVHPPYTGTALAADTPIGNAAAATNAMRANRDTVRS
jgi:hypothetical protein